MRVVIFIIVIFFAPNVFSESGKITYADCSFSISSEFSKNKATDYYYSSNKIFKSINLSDSEDPRAFFDESSEVKDLKIYKAKNFYVFAYELWLDVDVKNNLNVMDFVLLWRPDKSISFSGFKATDVKMLMGDCSAEWYLIDQKAFLDEVYGDK